MVKSISQIIEAARGLQGGCAAVASAHDEEVLRACAAARREGVADSVLVGDSGKISRILQSLGEKAEDWKIIDAASPQDCAALAVEQVRSGRCQLLMKGLLGTADLMRAVVDKERGLRTGRLLSHVMLYEAPSYPKLLALTDGGMNTYPDLDKKAGILENAAILLRALGYERISAACVCGAEVVDKKIQATLDAEALSGMTGRWQPYNMAVYGPVGLDLAVSREACRHKGYSAPGAGEADVLLVPTYEVGNGIGKALTYFAGAKSAGIIMGAAAPIVLVSRSDSAETKLASLALGCIAGQNI